MRYLDPKADLTFKKIFGERKDLVISFLNAMLPLEEDEEILEIEYLPAELVPETPLRKNTIVDVRCKDNKGRVFIVEMQMNWSSEFKQRVLYNASKAYVRQIETGHSYHLLKPVYCLALVNDVFEKNIEGYYHYYRMVHVEHTEKVIDGLQLILIELPKFNPQTYTEKRMRALWLRFLTEIKHGTEHINGDLLADPLIEKATVILKESSFSDAEMLSYERFWDVIATEATMMVGKYKQGFAEGMEKGEKEGRKKQSYEMARFLKDENMPLDKIVKYTNLSIEEIEQL